MSPSDDERAQIGALLGREPSGDFEVVLVDESGIARVIKNQPFLTDGTPMPTLYWLVSQQDRLLVSRLESAGGVGEAEAAVDSGRLADAHAAYAKERDALVDPQHQGHLPSGGVGGTRVGVKCLHAHYAYFLAGGPDPVGLWVSQQLGLGRGDAQPSSG